MPNYRNFGDVRVPNKKPNRFADYRIALVGEAPGENEEGRRIPFVGASGFLLDKCLAHAEIDRGACLVANVFQYRPDDNDISSVDRSDPAWTQSLEQLSADLEDFDPNVVVLLGGTALNVFTGKDKITSWRGSVIPGTLLGKTYKCIPSVHPAAASRDYSLKPHLCFDLERAKTHGFSKEIPKYDRNLDVDLSLEEILQRLGSIHSGDVIAFDIEGGCDHMSCISFATDPSYAFNIPFQTLQGNRRSGTGHSVWSRKDEITIYRAINRVLSDPTIKKITQNGIAYDAFVLAWTYRMVVNNIEDIMLLNWEIYPEQPKNLGFQISIWIEEPYHKDGRKEVDDFNFWRYCAKDSCTTLEIWYKQNEHVQSEEPSYRDAMLEHYAFNRDVAIAMLYTSLRGMVYDTSMVATAAAGIQKQLEEHQAYLDEKFGDCSFIKPAKVTKSKKTKAADLAAMLMDFGPVKPEAPATPIHGTFNVKSVAQKRALVYDLKGYRYYNRKARSWTCTDEMTLVTLANEHQDDDLWELIKAIRCRTALSSLALDEHGRPSRNVVDRDGRIRFSYNVVGTETGRTSCYKSNSGSGFNGQTITKTKGCNMRKFYRADPGYLYLQADLEGADSWTVAAYCRALGDPSMYNHLELGIKPAKVLRLVLMYDIDTVLGFDLPTLKSESKAAPDDELYRVCKAVGHGSAYKMGPTLVGDIIYKQTEGKVHFSPRECELYQNIFFKLYPGVKEYHAYIFQDVSDKGYIQSANGHRRYFLSIRWTKDPYGNYIIDPDTHRKALAEEPQGNTTYVTNRILHNLYYQEYNRREDGTFIIEPLHQIHDAINGQVRIVDVESGLAKRVFDIASNVILNIAGYDIKIPIDAKLGPSWGEPQFTLK